MVEDNFLNNTCITQNIPTLTPERVMVVPTIDCKYFCLFYEIMYFMLCQTGILEYDLVNFNTTDNMIARKNIK